MLDITINDKINISIDTETKADKHTHIHAVVLVLHLSILYRQGIKHNHFCVIFKGLSQKCHLFFYILVKFGHVIH